MPRRRSATPNTGASSATKKPMAVTPSQPGGSNYTGTPAPSQKAALPVNESVEIAPITYESEDDDDSAPINHGGEGGAECRDALCCVIFVAYVVGMALIGMTTFASADLTRLFHPTDYKGWTCGEEATDLNGNTVTTVAEKPLGIYPRLSEDTLYAIENKGDDCKVDKHTGNLPASCSVDLYTICIAECPQAGSIVCSYEREQEFAGLYGADVEKLRQAYATERDGCWWIAVDTSEYAGRCIPYPPDITSEEHTYCDFIGVDGVRTRTEISSVEHTECYGRIETVITTVESSTGGARTQFAGLVALNSGIAMFENVLNSWGLILFTGGIMSAGASFILVLGWLNDKLLSPLVWLCILGLLGVVVIGTMIAFVEHGSFFGVSLNSEAIPEDLQIVVDEAGGTEEDQDLALAAAGQSETSSLWVIPAYGGLVVSVLYTLAMLVGRDQIQRACKIIALCNDVMQKMPAIAMYPFFSAAMILALILYGLAIGIMLPSADMGVTSLADVAGHLVENGRCVNAADEIECIRQNAVLQLNATAQNADDGIQSDDELMVMATKPPLEYEPDSGSDDWFVNAVLAYHIFGILWGVQFIQSFVTISMAASVAEGYYARDEDGDGVIDYDKCAACKGFVRTLRYHAGSVALGSFVLTVSQPLQLPFEFISARCQGTLSAEAAAKSPLKNVLKKLSDCILFSYEKILKYCTPSAYVLIAVEGKGFFPSAWRSFKMLLSTKYKVEMVQSNMGTTMTVALLAVSGGCTLVFLFVVNTFASFTCYEIGVPKGCESKGEHYVSDPTAPAFLAFLLAVLIANAFMKVYSVTIDTMLYSFISESTLRKRQEKNNEAMIEMSSWGTELGTFLEELGQKTPAERMTDRARGKGGALELPTLRLRAKTGHVPLEQDTLGADVEALP